MARIVGNEQDAERSKAGKALDTAASIAGVRAATELLRKDLALVKDVVTETVEGFPRVKHIKGEPPGSFEEAMEQRRVGENKLPAIYRQHAILAWILWVMAAIVWGLLVHFIVTGVVFGIIVGLGIAPMVTAWAIRSGFFAWQIRERRLGGFWEFLQTPSEWWPGLYMD